MIGCVTNLRLRKYQQNHTCVGVVDMVGDGARDAGGHVGSCVGLVPSNGTAGAEFFLGDLGCSAAGPDFAFALALEVLGVGDDSLPLDFSAVLGVVLTVLLVMVVLSALFSSRIGLVA